MRSRAVGHLGLIAGALLGSAVELGDGDDGDLELLGEQLEGAGELRDLLLARLHALARAHELQVVDDHETQVVLLLEPQRLGADLGHREVRRVVDEQRRLAHRVVG